MTVFVDDMFAGYGTMLMCHMMADSREELLAMADTIGVRRKWIQHEGEPGEHFDICKSKRSLAVKAGAVEVELRTLCKMQMRRRAVGTLGTPEEALKWFDERHMAGKVSADGSSDGSDDT